MRLAVLADIHGNLPALSAVLADCEEHQVDGLLVAGDLIGGTDSPRIIERLQDFGSTAIRGNREEYLLALATGTAPESWYMGSQWASLRLLHRQLDGSALAYVAALPQQCTYSRDGASSIRVVHGTHREVSGLLVPERDPSVVALFERAGLFELRSSGASVSQALAEIEEEVLISGHTHIPWIQRHGKKLALNPGAVGLPINGDTRAQYALLYWWGGTWEVQHRAIWYDLDEIRCSYRETCQEDEGDAFARATLLCALTGHNVPGLLVLHSRRLASAAGFTDLNDAPDSVWAEAITTFDWEHWEAMT
jgi:predicted phosphodiesterase